MGIIIYTGEICRCVKGKLVKRLRSRKNRIWISRGIFARIKKRVWERRERIGKSS